MLSTGVGITYDKIGNPLSDGTWTYTWQNGRQLQKMQKSGETVEFVYNENGLRVQKTATTTGVTKYTLHGKNVVHMTQGSNELHFFYDARNKPAVVVYNNVPYSYVKNLQGDIVAILDSNKNVVVSYVYDAWGRPISCSGTMASTLGKINPFRYRSYIYDEEMGMYCLNSRYYSAEYCRNLSEDHYIGHPSSWPLTHDLYVYCKNDPINYQDTNGEWPIHIFLGAGIGLVCELVSDIYENFQNPGDRTGLELFIPDSPIEDYVGAAAGGAISSINASSYVMTAVWGAAGSLADAFISKDIDFEQSPEMVFEDIVWIAVEGGYYNAAGRFVQELFSIHDLKKARKTLNRAARKDLAQKLYPDMHNVNDQLFMLMNETGPVNFHPIKNTIYSTCVTTVIDAVVGD